MKLSHIAKSSLLIAFFFALDKGVGLLRVVLFNRQFLPADRDIFFVSNNIPDLLSALISGGALGMALIPVLTETLDEDGKEAAWTLFSRILNLAFLVTAGIAALIMVFARPLIEHFIAPGFTPEQWGIAARLMRLDLLAILIFSISGLVMGGLQTRQHFWLPAMAPMMYNLGQIVGIQILGPIFGIDGMVYGVILGALLHLGVQIPGLIYYQYRWQPSLNLAHPRVTQVLLLMGPRLLNMVFLQSYFLTRDRFASFFEEGAVSALNNGWFIQQVPETLIGTAIAIALLPTLSDLVARREDALFSKTVNHALRALLALTVPIAAVIAVVVRPLVAVVFGFEGYELDVVTDATRFFLIGLTGHTWLEVAVRSFYAMQKPRWPVIAAGLQAMSFILLGWLLSDWLGAAGIALADTITFSIQALGLLIALNLFFPGSLDVRPSLLRTGLSGIVGGSAAYLLLTYLPLPPFQASLVAGGLGGLLALPFIWPELLLLVRIGARKE
jgi:putative peptidoglycan lipid II flippase